nr:restriction endonuclease [Lysinibacillus sphaericus]
MQLLTFGISIAIGIWIYYKTSNQDDAIIGAMLTLVGLTVCKTLCRKNISIKRIDVMDGWEFEHYLGDLYKKKGYKTKVTSGSRDFGADLVLKKRGKKIVVQAKRYNRNVGVKAVQEVHSSIKYYKADEGWVVTNSYFTEPAIKLAKSTEIKLIDRDDLIKLVK